MKHVDGKWSEEFVILSKPVDGYPSRLGPQWFEERNPKKRQAGAQNVEPDKWMEHLVAIPNLQTDMEALRSWEKLAGEVINFTTPSCLQPKLEGDVSQLQWLLESWKDMADSTPLHCDSEQPQLPTRVVLPENSSGAVGDTGDNAVQPEDSSGSESDFNEPFNGASRTKSKADNRGNLLAVTGPVFIVPYANPAVGDLVLVDVTSSDYNPSHIPEPAQVTKVYVDKVMVGIPACYGYPALNFTLSLPMSSSLGLLQQ